VGTTFSRHSTSQPRSVRVLSAAIFTALTVTLALGAVSLAFAQEKPPVSSAAAKGALGSVPSAPIPESGTGTAPAASTAEEPAAGIANGATSLVGAVTSSAREQAATAGIGVAPESSQVVNYEANQQMPLNVQRLHSLQEFMKEGVNASPLGVELEEGARHGRNGREIDGLLVVALQPGSPAERGGVQAGHRVAHDLVEGATVATSLFFPPALFAVPVIETMQFGENYDLIIGVDGNRVANFMDFQDQLRDAQSGESVYLNILRRGKRLQLPVEMP
jgi:PDZ domain